MARTISEDNQVKGVLQNVIFAAKDSYFKILSVQVESDDFDWDEDELIVTGTFASVKPGSTYAFFGQLVTHPRYGQQFQAARYENQVATDEKGLVAFFSSGDFAGVGKKTAQKIVDALGAEALDKILADPKVLQGLVKPKVADNLVETLQNNMGLERLFVLGHKVGLSADLAGKLFDRYGEEAQNILQDDPYRLVYEMEGLPFKKVDAIAQQAGYTLDSKERIKAAVFAAIQNACFAHGHTFLTIEQAKNASWSLIGHDVTNPAEIIDQALGALVAEGRLVFDHDSYQPRELALAEQTVSNKIQELFQKKSDVQFTQQSIDDGFVLPGRLTLDNVQEAAVKQALSSQLFVLTGGPGTGKTTVTKTLVKTWEALVRSQAEQQGQNQEWLKEHRVRLASPTGRAAKRMTEITGYEATTIHRLLGISEGDDAEFDADNPLSGGLLIIDEASMLDISLAAALFSAIPKTMHVVLVGDADQLPSVGPGNVLFDLIHSQQVAHVALEHIYRQGKGSSISTLAASINDGQLPSDFQDKKRDRSTFLTNASQVPSAVGQVLQSAIKKGFTADQVQILAPMYKTAAGVRSLNQIAQDLFNPVEPGQKTLQYGDTVFRLGDKVLQLENDTERDIYNGDMGEVVAIHNQSDGAGKADALVVDFAGQEVWYTPKTLNQLTLAYATTIHKAQGNEFKLVILVLTSQFKIMLNQNLIYTAITRAKEALVMVGDYDAYQYAAEHEVPHRQTHLLADLDSGANGNAIESAPPQKKTAKALNAGLSQEVPHDLSDSAKVKIEHASDQTPVEKKPVSSKKFLPEDTLTAAHLAEGIDPMIGMAELSPLDFMPVDQ